MHSLNACTPKCNLVTHEHMFVFSIIIYTCACICRASASKTGADVTEGGGKTMGAESGSAAASGSELGRNSANSSDTSNKTSEIAYLTYDTLRGDQAEQVGFVNQYFVNQLVSGPKSIYRRNVLVECGSTQCEFEIKVYKIEETSYASRQTEASATPQRTGQQDRSTAEVHNNLDQSHENSPSDSAQSCPQLYAAGGSQQHAQMSNALPAVRSISEIHYDESRHSQHAETLPQLRARNSSLVRAFESSPLLEGNPSQGHVTNRSETLV